MASRGMLPKFRPAILGGQNSAPTRPVIRAVKPTAPLPPPSPPRRFPSGIDYAPGTAPYPANAMDPTTESFGDPITARHPSDIDLPDTFDDETRVRGEDGPRSRNNDDTRVHAYEETRLRSEPDASEFEVDEETRGRGDEFDCQTQDYGERRDSLISTRRAIVSHGFETERSLGDADERYIESLPDAPATLQDTRADDPPSFDGERPTEPPPRTYLSPPPPALDRDDDAGACQRPFGTPSNDNERPPFDSMKVAAPSPPPPVMTASMPERSVEIHPSPAPPAAMPTGAVLGMSTVPVAPTPMVPDHRARAMGVMPTQLSAAPPPELMALQLPPQYPPQPQYAAYAVPRMILSPSFAGGPHPASIEPAQIHYAHPPAIIARVPAVPTTRAERPTGSKVGRFAWFVFGSAFGLFFAFFATGYAKNLSAKSDTPTPANPAQPAATTPLPPAPLPATATAAATTAPVTPTTVVAAAPPQPAMPAAPTMTAAPAFVAPTAALAPQAPAPAPQRPRHVSVQRSAPRPAPAAAAPDADEDGLGPAPRGKSKDKAGDVGDLLNAGLAP